MKKINVIMFAVLLFISCGDNSAPTNPLMSDKGIGPITNVKIYDNIDTKMASMGEIAFNQNCVSCHKMDKKFIGPSLEQITERRSPEWIMNMILNPEVMVKENPIAKELLMEYIAPMANQSLSAQEARNILEYFRQYDETIKNKILKEEVK
tara:strand:+ start:891 stop:1343 length:453 start_codon:yes stop_codon:yes gene_type:complete